jgi:hypothetical protein
MEYWDGNITGSKLVDKYGARWNAINSALTIHGRWKCKPIQ